MGASATADEHDPAAVDVDSDTADVDDEAAAPHSRSGRVFFSVCAAGAGAGADDDDDDDNGVASSFTRSGRLNAGAAAADDVAVDDANADGAEEEENSEDDALVRCRLVCILEAMLQSCCEMTTPRVLSTKQSTSQQVINSNIPR